MKTTVGFFEFQDAFTNCGRENSFTYYGLKALYDYLTNMEEECDMEIEMDAVAIDCEYTEYADIKEAYEVYEDDFDSMGDDEEERNENAKEYLQDHTQVIEFEGGIIIANF